MVATNIESAANGLPNGHVAVGRGTVRTLGLEAFRSTVNHQYCFYLKNYQREAHLQLTHPDASAIERYLAYEHGPIAWTTPLGLTAWFLSAPAAIRAQAHNRASHPGLRERRERLPDASTISPRQIDPCAPAGRGDPAGAITVGSLASWASAYIDDVRGRAVIPASQD
jgi:hypothetical protein